MDTNILCLLCSNDTDRMVNYHFGFCLWPMAIVFAMTSPKYIRLSRMIACFMRAINTSMTDIIQHQHAKRHFFFIRFMSKICCYWVIIFKNEFFFQLLHLHTISSCDMVWYENVDLSIDL